MTFNELKEINNNKLNEYNKMQEENQDVTKEILIHKKIKLLLEEYPAVFFQIPMGEALKILAKLVDEDKIKETYASLISPEKYKELKNNFDL